MATPTAESVKAGIDEKLASWELTQDQVDTAMAQVKQPVQQTTTTEPTTVVDTTKQIEPVTQVTQVEQPVALPTTDSVQANIDEKLSSWELTQDQVDTAKAEIVDKREPVEPTKPVEDVKIGEDIQTFWYETNVLERQERNQGIAENLMTQDKWFDEEKLKEEIRLLAGDVTDEEIQNTVNDIGDRFNSLQNLSTLATTDSEALATAIGNGTITLNDIEWLKRTDPNKYNEIAGYVSYNKKIDTYNSTLNDFKNVFTDDKSKITVDYLEAINEKHKAWLKEVSGEDSLNEYQKALNDPKLLEQKEQLWQLNGDINALTEQINQMADSVKEDNPQIKDKWLLNAITADKTASLLKQKNALLIEAGTIESSVNNKIDNAQENYQLNLQRENIVRENIMTEYWMDKDVFAEWQRLLDRQLDKEEKQYRHDVWLEDQIYMMNVQDDQQRDYLRFQMDLQDQYQDDKLISFQAQDGSHVTYNADKWTYDVFNQWLVQADNIAKWIVEFAKDLEQKDVEYKMWAKVPWAGTIDCSWLNTAYAAQSWVISEEDARYWINAQSQYNESQDSWLFKEMGDVIPWDLIYFKEPDGKVSHVAIADGTMNEDGTIQVIDSSVSWWWVKTRTLNLTQEDKFGKYDLQGSWNWIENRLRNAEDEKYKAQQQYWPLYTQYFEWENPPVSVIDDLWWADVFTKQALDYYIPTKNTELATYWYTIDNPDLYISWWVDKKKRQWISDALNQKTELDSNIDRIKELLEEHWTEVTQRSKPWSELAQLETNIKLILKWEAGYALWVLAWPDMEILENTVKPTVWIKASSRITQNVIDDYTNLALMIDNKISPKLKAMWISAIWEEEEYNSWEDKLYSASKDEIDLSSYWYE